MTGRMFHIHKKILILPLNTSTFYFPININERIHKKKNDTATRSPWRADMDRHGEAELEMFST